MWIIPNTLTQLNGSLDTEAITSDSEEFFQTCASSLLVRSKHMRWKTLLRKWKKASWIQRLFGRIVKPSQQNHSKIEGWISSLLPIHAKESQSQEKEKVKNRLPGYGLTVEISSVLFDQHGVSLRTQEDIFRWDSPELYQTWKSWVTHQRGEYLARKKISTHMMMQSRSEIANILSLIEANALLMEESESSSLLKTKNWGTPRTTTNGGYPNVRASGKESRLEDQVINWRTPTAHQPGACAENLEGEVGHRMFVKGTDKHVRYGLIQQIKMAKKNNWPTPLATDAEKCPSASLARAVNPELLRSFRAREAKTWITPTARDYKDTGNMDLKGGGEEKSPSEAGIYRQVARQGEPQHPWEEPRTIEIVSNSGKFYDVLNPAWEEQLMNLPPGWTRLKDASRPEDNRVDRVRLIGNGVDPDTTENAFRILFKRFYKPLDTEQLFF